jgi:hypothetical protein
MNTCFPAALHSQTLVLVIRYSPYYTAALSPEEEASISAAARLSVNRLEEAGFSALDIGGDYSSADYADLQHLAESGGAKMAESVALKIRALAKRLQYTE